MLASLAMNVAWADLDCSSCNIAAMLPREALDFIAASCQDSNLDPGVVRRCAQLNADIESACQEDSEWAAFLTHYTGPCSPIPTRFLNQNNRHFSELIQMLTPTIAIDPQEQYPPTDIRRITERYPPVVAATGYLGYSRAVEAELSRPMPVTNIQCEGTMRGRQCCGSVNAPLYVDFSPPTPGRGGSLAARAHPDTYEVSFGTVHAFGSADAIQDEIDVAAGLHIARPNSGRHVVDNESTQFSYRVIRTGPDAGKVRLDTMSFSRHGGGVSEPMQACNDQGYVYPENLRSPRPGAPRHAVIFQARGGHAMYPSADASLSKSRMREADPGMTAADGIVPYTTWREIGQYIEPLEHTFRDGGCVTTLATDHILGTGSLWNHSVIGTRHLVHGAADICIEQEPSDPVTGRRHLRSFRQTASWLDGSLDGYRGYACGSAPEDDAIPYSNLPDQLLPH